MGMLVARSGRLGRVRMAAVVGFLLLGLLVVVPTGKARATIDVVVSRVTASDGRVFWVENHLVRPDEVAEADLSTATPAASASGKRYLLVWAGVVNLSDSHLADLDATGDRATNVVGPDFLAVIDAEPTSTTYGKVVNTATVGPVVENEPHHMQYLYHKGDRVFAGGLFTDTTYVFDVSQLPTIALAGVNLPQDTPCSSVPDAFWTLKDHTAYGTYMGGANVPGPCLYSNGEVRVSNGYGGSPGAIVHMGPDGKTLSEVPAALATSESPTECPNYPAIPGQATCANPHGIQAREDLKRVVASDYAEPRNIVLDPVAPFDDNIFRNTVRTYDTTDPNNPTLVSVATMPESPRPAYPVRILAGSVMQAVSKRGMMETTVTNLPENKGAFASSMCGGVIYYTPDITVSNPQWREVFDDTTAARAITPGAAPIAACDGSGWLQTSPDDKHLYHAVIGRNPGTFAPDDPGIPKMVYSLNIAKLLASGAAPSCSIDTMAEVLDGGAETDCPTLSGALAISDTSTGGPHWGALDNFAPTGSGRFKEATKISRMAVSNYFVARAGFDGNHKVCMLNLTSAGGISLDNSFKDEISGTPCVDFNRDSWPHGPFGNAKPHSELFVAADAFLE